MSSPDPSVLSTQPAVAGPAVAASRRNELDKEAFMKLLITQLRHQDPLRAGDDREFIAQLAQFSALEQTQQLTQRLSSFLNFQQLTQGSTLIGRTVEVIDPATGLPQQGTVREVRLGDGLPRIVVNDRVYDISAIQRLL